MSHIFRLHPEGTNTFKHWEGSTENKYGNNVIEQINDPNGGSASKEITSIPSPFARIDLIKTAFKKVVDSNLDGNTIYHKMVSDSLDVGQLFFNIDKFQDQLEIIIWDKQNDLNALLNSPYPEHRQLGKTYEIFLKQDGDSYNFSKMDRMFLLNYKHGPSRTNIIGATSPATLFFTSANQPDYVGQTIRFGNNMPFDDPFIPLYKRDLEYQKYWYLLQKTIPNFAKWFPEVNAYLDESFKSLHVEKPQYAQKIHELTPQDMDQYRDIQVNGAGNLVQVLGFSLKQKDQNPNNIQQNSGFVIQSSHTVNGLSPLVLPVGSYALPVIYTQDIWNKNTSVPYYSPLPLTERSLPGDGTKYPFLTISDFLEDTMIRMSYELNTNGFFDGNISKPESNSYLLPLTDLFFEFFTVEQLQSEMPDGKKMIEIKPHAGGVSVFLRIPIHQSYIEYHRRYFLHNTPNLEKNEGALIEKKLGLGLFPPVRFSEKVKKHYRIALFDKGAKDIELHCFDKDTVVHAKAKTIRYKKDIDDTICSVEAYVINRNFDRIHVSVGQSKGVIVPKFLTKTGSAEYTFAVDFGTTNTHIEYSIDGSPSMPFTISTAEKQMQRLHPDYKQDKDIKNAFEDNFIPDTIADGDWYSFPMRTVFAEYTEIDYTKPVYSLADGNIPFLYEKAQIPPHNTIKTNLKWSSKEQGRVKLYLENIFILLRNKVLINGGRLDKTKIIWFYPASMTEAHYNRFQSIWKVLYKEYFGDQAGNIITMSESIAPYYYYRKKLGAKSRTVTVDIGGGTTDVYVVESKEPKMLSSFRFASNAIFGDAYNWDSDNNGFVSLYKNEFINILTNNGLEELKKAFQSIESRKVSSDIVAFLFALSSNRQVKNNDALDFLKKLADNDKLVYVFILFYSAILYYVANTMKSKGLDMPLTLAFSGAGSKTLRILSEDKKTLAKYVKLIFEKVYGQVYDATNDLDIIFEENPKEATCKGGIVNPQKQEYDEIDTIKASLLGCNTATFVNSYSYAEITPEIQEQIVQEVLNFIDFTFDLHKENNNFFQKKFSADVGILPFVRETCQKDLREYIKLGLEHKMEELKDLGADNTIEETLFFYPIVGMLNRLAREISCLS
ncbi:MAG: hypothetical protein LBV57_03720 [Candidatus Symbiothrix sp.]|jgi:hypothetical protein|nr:hypothetical protein [Candidatus Symbiothrix sp.]